MQILNPVRDVMSVEDNRTPPRSAAFEMPTFLNIRIYNPHETFNVFRIANANTQEGLIAN